MRVVLDTNVVMSALFFRGHPLKILEAWKERRIELVVSEDILLEYEEIADRLSCRYPMVDAHPWIEFIRENATKMDVRSPYSAVCEDADYDAFVACALAAGATVICSGDRHLLAVDGHQGLEVLVPKRFLDKYL